MPRGDGCQPLSRDVQMLSESLVQFSVDRRSYVPSLCFGWRPNYGRVNGEVKLLSRVQLFVTPWTVAYQAPPSMGFSRQEYWSGLPFPSLGDLPDSGIEPKSPALEADASTSEPPGLMVTAFKRAYATRCYHSQGCCIQCPDPTAANHRPTPPPEAPGHSQVGLAQSLVGPLLLSPGSWCAGSSVPSESLLPQSCGVL